MTGVTLSGTIGWNVMSSGTDADGAELPWKWSAYAPFGGTWGYEETCDAATRRAREEYARLTGEDA